MMPPKVAKTEMDEFTGAITRALRRAARAARKTASNSGTPIYVCREGKVVAIKPKKS